MRQAVKSWGAGVSAAVIRFLRRSSIYRRLFVSFLIIILVTNSIIALISYTISARKMDRDIAASTRQVLNGMISSIDIKLAHYEDLSNQIGSNIQVRNLLQECARLHAQGLMDADARQKYEDCRKQLEYQLYQASLPFDVSNVEILSGFDEFTEIDFAGNPQGASLSDPEGYRGSAPYQRASDANGSFIWYDTSKEQGVFRYEKSAYLHISGYLTLLRSIPDFGEDHPLGVIIINVPLTIFNHMVDLHSMYDRNEVVFLAGRKGTAIVINSTYLIDRMPDTETVGRLAEAGSGTVTEKVAGRRTMFVFSALDSLNMSIVYMVGKREVYRSIDLIRNSIIGVMAGCILVSLLISHFVTASIFLPLKQLEKAMKQVGNNDLRVEYRDDMRDEIGILGMQFNGMLGRIRNLLDTLIEEERMRKDEQIKRKDAELDALQMQIDPHFMYNTLDLIRWNAMFEENGDGKVSQMLSKFSAFLHFHTAHADKLVDVDEEIRHVQAYTAVLRFKDDRRIELRADIADEIRHCRIPKLTFQPIVENAVKHGIQTRSQLIVIDISAQRENRDLWIRIRDNGSGIAPEWLAILNDRLRRNDTSGTSIGLKNVNERIRLHFGEQYGLALESEPGSHTTVTIHTPAIEKT